MRPSICERNLDECDFGQFAHRVLGDEQFPPTRPERQTSDHSWAIELDGSQENPWILQRPSLDLVPAASRRQHRKAGMKRDRDRIAQVRIPDTLYLRFTSRSDTMSAVVESLAAW